MSFSSTEMKTPPASPASRRSNSPSVSASWYEKMDVKMASERDQFDYFYFLITESKIYPDTSEQRSKIDELNFLEHNNSPKEKLNKLAKLLAAFLYPLAREYHCRDLKNPEPITTLAGDKHKSKIEYLTAFLYHPTLFQHFNFHMMEFAPRDHLIPEDHQHYSKTLVAIRKATLNTHLIEAVTAQSDEKIRERNFNWAKSILKSAEYDKDIVDKNSPIQYVSLYDIEMIHLLLNNKALMIDSFLKTMDANLAAREKFFASIIEKALNQTECRWRVETIEMIAQHSNWKEKLFELLVETAKKSTQPGAELSKILNNKSTTLHKIFATHRGLGMFAGFGTTAGGTLAKIEALRDQYKHKQPSPTAKSTATL